jgi:hypothetical protein
MRASHVRPIGGDPFEAAVRQPGERHSFDPVGLYAKFCGTDYFARRNQGSQSSNQSGVMDTATANQHVLRFWLVGKQRIANAACGQLQQRSLDIFGRYVGKRGKVGSQPRQIE